MIRAYARVSSKNQERYGNGLETQIAELKAKSTLTHSRVLKVPDLILINY